jgi:hypothetical protein
MSHQDEFLAVKFGGKKLVPGRLFKIASKAKTLTFSLSVKKKSTWSIVYDELSLTVQTGSELLLYTKTNKAVQLTIDENQEELVQKLFSKIELDDDEGIKTPFVSLNSHSQSKSLKIHTDLQSPSKNNANSDRVPAAVSKGQLLFF